MIGVDTKDIRVYLMLVLTGVILVGIAASLYLVSRRQEIRPKAAFGRVELSLSPSSGSYGIGEDFNVDLKIDAGQFRVSAANIEVSYDPNYLSVLNVEENRATLDAVLVKDFGTLGIIKYVALKSPDSEENFPTGTFSLATITFRGNNVSADLATSVTYTGKEITGINPDDPLDKALESEPVRASYIISDTSPTEIPTVTPTPTICSGGDESQPQAKLLFDAQPQEYSWKIEEPKYGDDDLINETFQNYGGQAFPGNKNPYGVEVYTCESNGGQIKQDQGKPLDYYTKRSLDICIPRQDTNRKWPNDIYPNNLDISCQAAQFLVDGPAQKEDRRTENHTKEICTKVLGQKGANPHLDFTTDFEFKNYMQQAGNEVVLAGRADPQSSVCAGLPSNPTKAPVDLTPDQLSCYLYFDDVAVVSVWKEGNEANKKTKTIKYTSADGVHPVPGPSVSLSDLFGEEEGKYKVNIKVFDEGTSVYGSGDLWLTWKSALPPCPSITPTPTPGVDSPPTSTPTPIVIPPSPDDQVVIPIGEKESLVINIGEPPIDPNTPYISFKVKLLAAEKKPDIKVRLKLVDLLTQLTPAPAPKNSCNREGEGEHLYQNILMTHVGEGVYKPKPSSKFNYRGKQFSITQDGFLPLIDARSERPYAFYVKGPKHRNIRMEQNVTLEKGKSQSQEFSWLGLPLEPGDLPNPNKENQQDCVVNSIDLSLIESRIGATDTANLDIADVNFDGVVSGADISKVVNTLSTKPDDDI